MFTHQIARVIFSHFSLTQGRADCHTSVAPVKFPASKPRAPTHGSPTPDPQPSVGIPTSQPTPVPTRAAQPQPTSSPTHHITTWRADDGGFLFVDDVTNVGGGVGSPEYGQQNDANISAPVGASFLWAVADVVNLGDTPYTSSPDDFHLTGDDGGVYRSCAGNPPGTNPINMTVATLQKGDTTNGWLCWIVPARDNSLAVSWNEGGAIPWTPVAQIRLNFGSRHV